MHREPTESLEQSLPSPAAATSSPPYHHGSLCQVSNGLGRARSAASRSPRSPRSASPRRVCRDAADGADIDATLLDERLRGLKPRRGSAARAGPVVAGQRILDYENALSPPAPRRAMGLRAARHSDSSNGVQLTDLPNEILTQVLSHLHPDSHASVALVSKRFYALVTTPHAWRMAFIRHFPGHSLLERTESAKSEADARPGPSSDLVRLETRYFGRLTPLATWRSEYLLRTRLIRSLARGKPGAGSSPGSSGSSCRTSASGRRSAVLTYNSKLPWLITNIHAVFSDDKKPARAIQGSADLGVATMSDPTSGRVEKWGLQDPFTAAQMEDVAPSLVPYGLGEGPAAAPNVMDVSQPHGVLCGEGFPGGRAYFRAPDASCGCYLGAGSGVADTYPDIPKIPDMLDAVCSVWIAKSWAVPATTRSMCGMLTGSALGVVTAFSLGSASGRPRHAKGDMTARWVLSPGVPIVSLKVDDNYSAKRASLARVWAVALNALGEVYYLTEIPAAPLNRPDGDDVGKHAWLTGRSVDWHLMESTRRVARPDELDKNAVRGAYTPRPSSDSMRLSQEQLVAEAREVEKFLHHRPAHFRRVCEGWDMLRRLEVDFAADDGEGAGEGVFVIDCGLAEGRPALVRRFSRRLQEQRASESTRRPSPAAAGSSPRRDAPSSIFGAVGRGALHRPADEGTPEPATAEAVAEPVGVSHEWLCSVFELEGHSHVTISTSGMEGSSQAVLTLAEDPLRHGREEAATFPWMGRAGQAAGEIPGRRARLVAVGTKSGAMLVWNARHGRADSVRPLRIVQTESPEISCLAISALYLVHGGSDGLVQAWDALASVTDPVRTLNARSNGRVPRHMAAMNPAPLRQGSYSAVGAICLDPDPAALRGVLSFGTSLRYWTYGSSDQAGGRKRRPRHSNAHGRPTGRRLGGAVSGYIAAEEAELRRDNEQRMRERAWLRTRFGVGTLGDLTEEEAMRYAQAMSEEAFRLDEQRRVSDSAADAGPDTASSSCETATDAAAPEPSLDDADAGWQPKGTAAGGGGGGEASEFERQIQQAIRLSLLEGSDEEGAPPRGSSHSESECAVKSGPKGSTGSGPSASPPAVSALGPGDEDEDLALALRLSVQEQ